MSKKIKKSNEEKSAEEYFPIDADDYRNTTEKKVKESRGFDDVTQVTEKRVKPVVEMKSKSVEKKYKSVNKKSLEIVEKNPRKKRTKKKAMISKGVRQKSKVGGKKKVSRKTTIKEKKYIPKKIELKDKGYELIITEKPQAAAKIANALGVPTQKTESKIAYYEIDRKGKRIVVACAVGHLFSLKQNVPGSEVPIFDVSWVPNYMVRKKDFTKRYSDLISKLAKNAGSLTVATDFDIEGEVIGLNVVRFLCGQKDASRMKFSTLTDKELNDAYDNKMKSISWDQALAGEARHYLDWFYGINLSRALMNAIKSVGKFKLMSIGRVQGPTLNLIVQKEREINAFESKKYWQVFIRTKDPVVDLKYVKDIFQKDELKKFEGIVGKTGKGETKKREQILPPNVPFNLTGLQSEAYKLYGITPSATLRVAQSLYLASLISYPRTSSQKLPEAIGYKAILDKLKIRYKVAKLIINEKPIEGKKSDPAHPSIYPTGNKQVLSGDEEKIYDLIVKRFLALFCDPAILDKKRITLEVDGLVFSGNGTAIQKKSWLEFYPNKFKENQVPDLEGDIVVADLWDEEKETQPPRRYSPASIVSELEKRNLGTKATRAAILETLYDRGYIKEKSIEATALGISLIETLEKYSPIIIDENLTSGLQKEMDDIVEGGEKNISELKKMEDKIIDKARESVIEISKDFEKSEKEIGNELINANVKLIAEKKIENTLCKCPNCSKGNLAITYSKKTRKNFVACDAYPDCKTTYSLPPNGTIKKVGKICEDCGFPLMMRLQPRRKPWIFCFNTNCSSNQERLEEYRKKKEENNN